MTAHYNQRTRGLDFECDICASMDHGKTALPDGWLRVTTREHTLDVCSECVHALEEKDLLTPLVDANCNLILFHRAEMENE